MKRCAMLLLSALLLVSVLCGCGQDPVPTQTSTTQTASEPTSASPQPAARRVVLPYMSADVLNPFKTESRLNRDLAALLFDPLYRVDETFDAVGILAEDAETDGDTLTVTLREGLRFTSGELLTGRDVAYSFQYAKDSAWYAPRLENVYACTAEDESVRFTLLSPDVFALNCLDFPVMKFGTGEDEMPVGTGRYRLAEADGKPCLLRNENSSSFDEVELEQIALLDVKMVQNPLSLLQIGELSCYLLDPTLEKWQKVSSNMEPVHLNNLVFLGINSQSERLADPAVRRAVTLGIDQAQIVDSAYDTMAQKTTAPFNPAWSRMLPLQQNETFNAALAEQTLEDANYTFAGPRARLRKKDGIVLQLDLLVNSENAGRVAAAKLIQTQLEDLGIGINLKKTDYESYLTVLQSGGYDLYLGEVKLTANMSLSPFFDEDGAAGFGIDRSGSVCSAYNDLRSGSIDLSTFLKVFAQEPPFLPLCFRNAVLYYTNELSYEGSVSENDLYGNLYSWSLGTR